MIGKHIARFLGTSEDPLIIPAERVATVRSENNLLHALTLLSTLGYSSVPVLDRQGLLVGSITLAHIVNAVKTLESYDWEALLTGSVEEAMDRDPDRVSPDCELEDVMHGLVDNNYLAVADSSGKFFGIVTRKTMLKRLNRLLHGFEQSYQVKPAKEELSPTSPLAWAGLSR